MKKKIPRFIQAFLYIFIIFQFAHFFHHFAHP